MRNAAVLKLLAVLLLIALICTVITGYYEPKPKPEDTISNLEKAINHFDVDGFLACIDSKWAEKIETVLAFSGREKGVSAEKFVALVKSAMPILPFITDGKIDAGDMPRVEFTVLDTEIVDDTATVALAGLLTWGSHTKPFAATVDMKLENDAWVIYAIR